MLNPHGAFGRRFEIEDSCCRQAVSTCLEDMMSTQFTVFFDGRYWVGVLEIVEDQRLRAASHVFGAEPTGPELYEFALHRFAALAARARASSAVPIENAAGSTRRPGNPKRAARMLAKERAAPPVSTAGQQAMKETVTARAADRRAAHRRAREQDRQQQHAADHRKARERHRGHR